MNDEGKTSPDTRSHLLDANPKYRVLGHRGTDSRLGRGSPGRGAMGKEAKKYQVEELREWFDKLEVKS